MLEPKLVTRHDLIMIKAHSAEITRYANRIYRVITDIEKQPSLDVFLLRPLTAEYLHNQASGIESTIRTLRDLLLAINARPSIVCEDCDTTPKPNARRVPIKGN